MDNILARDNYIVVRNFIPRQRALDLSQEFVEYCDDFELGGDEQVFSSQSVHNYISFLELLNEKSNFISAQIRETVLPTYCYARHYLNDSILKPHKDRPSCEISVTVHLDGDQDWPIYIKTPQDVTKGITLHPGDAMIYLGMRGKHWRNNYPGQSYTQVFLHYVRSRGECSDYYFDRLNERPKSHHT